MARIRKHQSNFLIKKIGRIQALSFLNLCTLFLSTFSLYATPKGEPTGVIPHSATLDAEMLKKLAYSGIFFCLEIAFEPPIEAPSEEWEGGVQFLTDFSNKGDVFRKWLEYAKLHPDNATVIDDEENYLFYYSHDK